MARMLLILFVVMSFPVIAQETDYFVRKDSLRQARLDSIQEVFFVAHYQLDSVHINMAMLIGHGSDKDKMEDWNNTIVKSHQRLDSLEVSYRKKLQELSQHPLDKLDVKTANRDTSWVRFFREVNNNIASLEKDVRQQWSIRKDRIMKRLKPISDSLNAKQDLWPSLDNKNINNLDGLVQEEVFDFSNNIPELDYEELKMDDPLKRVKDPLGKVDYSPKLEIQNPLNIDMIKDIQPELSKVEGITGMVSDYTEDIIKIGSAEQAEKLADIAAEEVGGISGIDELTRHEKKLEAIRNKREKQMKLIQQYQDKDFIRKQLNDKTKNVVNEELIGKNDKIVKATQQLAKHKKNYDEIQSVNNLPRRPPNPMRGKPLRERILPGVVFQIQKTDILSVYISPQANYSITKRWAVGLGGLVRLRGTINDSLRYIDRDFLYGFKVYAKFLLFKGFGIRGEWEPLRVPLPLDDAAVVPFKKWVNGYLIGVDKGFSVNRRWRGNVQILYNLDYEKELTPYSSRVNFRFGFFIDANKMQKLPGM